MTPAQLAIYDQVESAFGADLDALAETVRRLKAKDRTHEEAVCDLIEMLQNGEFADVIRLSNLLGVAVGRLSIEGGAAS